MASLTADASIQAGSLSPEKIRRDGEEDWSGAVEVWRSVSDTRRQVRVLKPY